MSKTYDPDKVHFTSDLHLFHANIIKHCNRPFASVGEMNAAIVARWNERVRPGDTVFVVGDVSFGSGRQTHALLNDEMNGYKVLVKGNHDEKLLKDAAFRTCFTGIDSLLEIKVRDPDAHLGKQRIVLCHYAMRVWNRSFRGAWHLYGHSHGKLPEDRYKSFDVGVDAHDFRPWSYWEVKEKMKSKEDTLFEIRSETANMR